MWPQLTQQKMRDKIGSLGAVPRSGYLSATSKKPFSANKFGEGNGSNINVNVVFLKNSATKSVFSGMP
jgi:hypothetical protein